MSYPQQTFANFQELLNFINTFWVTNGVQEIDAVIGNDVVNGLLTFITQSPLNYQKAAIVSSGGTVVTTQPVTVIMGTVPSSLNWIDNIYNQNIFINTTASDIPLANGIIYYNAALVVQNSIPAQSTISIAKAKNGQWIQINQSTNSGFGTIHISIISIDFEDDGITYLNPLVVSDNISLFWSDLPNYIYQDAGQWEYVEGGLRILIPGFDATLNNYHLELDIKKIN